MNLMGNYFAIAIVAFLSGALFGAVVYRLFQGDAGKRRRVEQQMDELQQTHTRYQAQVNEHFMQTAQLVNRLNEDYREFHSHLAHGATTLCNEESADSLLALSEESSTANILEAETEPETVEESSVEPPRDYAPKSEQEKGTLSEDFGLEESDKKKALNE